MDDWFHAIRRGSAPDSTLLTLFCELTEDLCARARELDKSDPRPSALMLTGNREEDLWRACIAAWARLKDSRPNDAIAAITPVWNSYTPVKRSDQLVDTELLNLIGECLSRDHRTVEAANFTRWAHEVLLEFLKGCPQHPDKSGAQVALMLKAFLGDGTAPFFTTHELARALLAPWAVTRGLDLLTEIARRGLEYLEDGRDAVEGLLGDVRLLVEATETRLDDPQIAKVQIVIGDCCQIEDPEMAAMCYRNAVKTLGKQDPFGFNASVKLALLGDDADAESRFASLKDEAEARGHSAGAAQLWVQACRARWLRTHDTAVRKNLVAAIDLYERQIPHGGDPRTMFDYKQYIETGYRLLMTVNAYDQDRSDQRLDEILSGVRAMLSADRRAELRPDAEDDFWEALLARQRRPLAALRTALSPLPGVGILHLAVGIGCLVWVAYGYGRDREFRSGWGACGEETIKRLRDFFCCMQKQLEADKTNDAIAVTALGARLEQLGDQIGHDLPAEVLAVLRSMKLLVYAPVPVGNIDEFPLAGIRVEGRWLTDILPITRTTTFNLLLESLCPNLAEIQPHKRAIVVLGAPDTGGPPLRGALNHADAVQHMLKQFGFEAIIADNARRRDLDSWLDGGTGILHYIGHGIANEILETLPLPTGEHFDATDAELYRGYRLPFVFLCACVAGRIRYGKGGHLIGLLTGLLDRGAPAGVAFTLPMPEQHAYAIADQFYRHAYRLPIAQAVAETQAAVRPTMPAYACLAVAAYGDPVFSLRAKVGPGPIPMMRKQAATWHSAVRKHCVLRTDASADAVRDQLGEVPPSLSSYLRQWLASAFVDRADDPSWTHLEEHAAAATELSDVERLTTHAAGCAARLHASQLHRWPKDKPHDFLSLPTLLAEAMFLSRLGAALYDARLNGLGLSLMGRVQDLLDIEASLELALSEGVAKLWDCEDISPFVRALLEGSREILVQRGVKFSEHR